jgi:hypothetical protein
LQGIEPDKAESILLKKRRLTISRAKTIFTAIYLRGSSPLPVPWLIEKDDWILGAVVGLNSIQ